MVLAVWRDIDHNGGRTVHEWFLPEGTLNFGREIVRGRDAIAEIYRKRRDGTGRVARHVATNLHEERLDEVTARVTSIVVLFAGNGTPPLPQLVPQFVGDVEDVFVRTAGEWRLRSRTMTPVFFSPEVELAVPMK
ncbi:MAG TPA: nuclear transport factor 2 family protein [Amycolatopsis sp.]|nr:nuclear transport factor 2 family protein [Amycolatopsis sp.]